MSQQGEHNSGLDSEYASGRRESPPNSLHRHGPDAGRLSAAASLDIEAAGLLDKVTSDACHRICVAASMRDQARPRWATPQDEAEDAAIRDGAWAAARWRTTLLANLAVVMERTDECVSLHHMMH
jgi:hypothetical protein